MMPNITIKVEDLDLKEKGEDGLNNPFVGIIELEIPFYEDRVKLMKTMNLTKMDDLDSGIALLELVKKNVKSVDVTHKDADAKFASIEELGFYLEGSKLINQVGKAILSGPKLGKS
jgi:hypothetical protein